MELSKTTAKLSRGSYSINSVANLMNDRYQVTSLYTGLCRWNKLPASALISMAAKHCSNLNMPLVYSEAISSVTGVCNKQWSRRDEVRYHVYAGMVGDEIFTGIKGEQAYQVYHLVLACNEAYCKDRTDWDLFENYINGALTTNYSPTIAEEYIGMILRDALVTFSV